MGWRGADWRVELCLLRALRDGVSLQCLDGKVDATDYSRIDNGYLNHLTGWYNGDFNYDGVVNGSDYTLIDNAFNMQGAQLSAEVATATDQVSPVTVDFGELPSGLTSASSVDSSLGVEDSLAVPEPTMLSLLAIGALSLLGRRRRSY